MRHSCRSKEGALTSSLTPFSHDLEGWRVLPAEAQRMGGGEGLGGQYNSFHQTTSTIWPSGC